MFKIHSYAPAFGEPSASPFCVKAMLLCQMAGLKYGQDWAIQWAFDPRKAPKGKFPLLQDGDQIIADSAFIRRHLETCLAIDFDTGLSDVQKAQSRMAIHLAEDHLYWMLVVDRWRREDNWTILRKAYFGHLRPPLSWFVPNLARKKSFAQMNGQGIGRHSEVEILTFAVADFDAIETLLGDQAFLFGDKPTAADASVAPMLAAIIGSPCDSMLRTELKGRAQLVSYCARVRDRLYGDLPTNLSK